MIKILQGTAFKYKVPSEDCQLVASDGINKIQVVDILADTDGSFWLTATAEMTQAWQPTIYNYQIISSDGLVEEGKMSVKANLLYWKSVDSYWATVVKAVEAKLAGKADDAAYSISVGDKHINYMSVDELLKLLNFAKGKLAEEEAEEAGEIPYDRNNQHIIRYFWR